jgi:hypothetical protein
MLIAGYSQLVLSAVESEISIASTPKGADVFLMKGNKRIHLGKTPLTRKIKFHSNVSQVRLLFEKQGLNPVTLTVMASDREITADLNRQSYTQNPELHNDPYMRHLQSRINVILQPQLENIFKNMQHGFVLSSPAALTGSKGKVSLVVSLKDSTGNHPLQRSQQTGLSKVLKQLWSRLGRWVMLPMAEQMSSVQEVATLSVKLIQNKEKNQLTVKPTMTTKTEMQCMPGYRTQQVLRFKQVPQYESYSDKYGFHTRLTGYKTESYLDNQQIYEPCHQKVPVTQVVPTTTASLEQGRSGYIEFSMKLDDYKAGMSNEQTYKTLSIVQTISGSRKTLKSPGALSIRP